MSGRATAAHVSSAPASRGQGRSLAGLIDVLDRADGAPEGRRPQARRATVHRAGGPRSGAVRTVPLRSVQPAPMARALPVPRAYVVPEPERVPVTGLSDLVRRAAMWGAGQRGEYLAWRVAPQPTAPQSLPSQATPPQARPPQSAAPAARRPARVRSLVRRLAMWGSGPGGKYLAWGGPAFPDRPRVVDPPVVLREMPSTPTIQPAAPSPAAALLPRAPASSAGTRGMPPVPRGAVAVPGVRPGGPPERSRATGWPSQSHASPVATGLVRARGDPLSWPARGSPPPARRSRSPGSARSSFP
jgi:hypothetical protein